MIFSRKKRRHPLPKFPPNVAKTFKDLCKDLPEVKIERLQKAVNKHFQKKIAEDGPSTNYDDFEAKEILKVCNHLLDSYQNYPPDKQRLIIGAIRYAASTDDPFSDQMFASGMTDDKQVLNYVLEELDIHGHFLELY